MVDEGGRIESQRMERSQASTRGSLVGGRGGVVIDIVEIAYHSLSFHQNNFAKVKG